MKVGDLVRWRPHLPFVLESAYGIVVEIIDEYMVGVLWLSSPYVYMEAVDNLEVINEKTTSEDKEGIPNKK
tara:strand:+ start:140 stop:352 length:213 start_codon:yes stop_codon:yes gene_type:complete